MAGEIHYKRKSGQSVALIFLIFVMVVAVCFWQLSFLQDFFLGERSTLVGRVFNAIIVVVFLVGTTNIVRLLLSYRLEEAAVINLYENFAHKSNSPFHNVSDDSFIGRRFRILESLSEKHTPINHGALASILEAELTRRASFPRFVGSILILLGMLGTIVSLAISLLGASNLLESMTDPNGMSTIINGMSTALSTTMTGIVAYILIRFFQSKLNDVQSNLLYSIERVTALTLLPQFATTPEAILPKLSGLLSKLDELVSGMVQNSQNLSEAQARFGEVINDQTENFSSMVNSLNEVNQNLAKGFRL